MIKSWAERVIFSIVFLIIVIGVILSRVDLPFFEGFYVREDGFIEWLTIVALSSGAFLCFYRTFKLKSQRTFMFLLGMVLMGLVFIFGVGEEISWGQRILNIESSEFFMKHNAQREINIHNLIVNGKKINKIIFGTLLGVCIGAYFLILPIFYRKIDGIKQFVNRFAIPVPRVFHIISYIILIILVSIVNSSKKGELLEFGGCWILLLMIFSPYNREIFKE
jgi:hypothetical protein